MQATSAAAEPASKRASHDPKLWPFTCLLDQNCCVSLGNGAASLPTAWYRCVSWTETVVSASPIVLQTLQTACLVHAGLPRQGH